MEFVMKLAVKGSKTYASHDRASTALELKLRQLGEDRVPRFLIAANAEGRFYPVVMNDDKFAYLIHHGIAVVG